MFLFNIVCFFFKQKTAYEMRISDWSSDVCSSDLPYYRFLCKRPLSSDEFYPTFNRPNVELVDVSDTKGVERLTEKGFVANGKEYEVDCMIFASGFEVTSDQIGRHTSELQSLMRISYAVFCLKKKIYTTST